MGVAVALVIVATLLIAAYYASRRGQREGFHGHRGGWGRGGWGRGGWGRGGWGRGWTAPRSWGGWATPRWWHGWGVPADCWSCQACGSLDPYATSSYCAACAVRCPQYN